jgi:hypothetical protein
MKYQSTLEGDKAKHYRLVSITREAERFISYCKRDSFRPEERLINFKEVKQ